MKNHILALALSVTLIFSGCATVPTGEAPSASQKAWAFFQEQLPNIPTVVATATRIAIPYIEKNPEQRAALVAQINKVSTALDSILAKGTFDPEAVAEAFKVEDPTLNLIFTGVSVMYNGYYSQLLKNEDVAMAWQLVDAIAKGVKQGTE